MERYGDEVTPFKKGFACEHNRLNSYIREPFSQLLIMDVQSFHFEHWIERRKGEVKNASINRDLGLLSAVFEAAKGWPQRPKVSNDLLQPHS